MKSEEKSTARNWLKQYLFSLLLSVGVLGSIYFVFGIFWEESMKIPPAIIYAQISAPPYDAWFNESFLFQPPIVAYVSSVFDTIPVLGIWHFMLLTFYFSITLHLVLRILMRIIALQKLIIVCLSVLLTIGIIGSSLVYIHLGREALLLTTMSALLFIEYTVENERKPWLFVFTFFLGCLMRVSLGLFVLSAISVLLWLHYRSIKKVFALFIWQWVIGITCIVIVLVYKFNVNNPGVIIEQNYEYALMDRGAVLPLSTMKSKTDSVRYEALTHYFLITDSENINIPFIQHVIDADKFYKFGFNFDDINHLKETLLPLLSTYSKTIFLLYILLFIAAWGGNKRTGTTLLFFHVFCWSIVCFLSMKISMYERFLLPWMALIFMGSLLFMSFQNNPLGKRRGLLLLLFSVCLFAITFHQMKNISSNEKEYNQHASKYLKQIEQLSTYSTPVLWDYTQCYFPSHLFTRTEGNVLKGSLYQTMFFIAYFPFGQERCIQKTGVSPLNFNKFGEALLQHRNNYSFVMEERTALFLAKYYKELYGMNMAFVCDSPRTEIVKNNFLYSLH